ncbi:MAG: tRNA(Met) cytidine acetyltransferase TmcA [Thermoprotei archaeon]
MELFVDSLKDGIERFYRNLVYVEGENYRDVILDYLKAFHSVNPNATVGYAYHPWSERAKALMTEVEALFPNLVPIDYLESEKFLGYTFDAVVIDALDNFEPNFVGRLVDLVRGGGLVAIVTDDLTRDKKYRNSIVRNGQIESYYEERFRRKFREHEAVFAHIKGEAVIRPFRGELPPPPKPRIPDKRFMPLELHQLCKTPDQNATLEAFRFMVGTGRRVLALTAARGRGKSAVTGLALAGLIHDRLQEGRSVSVALTSPSALGVSQITEFLTIGLKALGIKFKVQKNANDVTVTVRGDGFRVYWEPPETTLEDEADLLVVDEAAAIGMNYVENAVNAWRKVVLVTTVHGYEGSGKTFLRYLRRILEEKRVQTKWVSMTTPLRYSKGDPIERWLYDSLLLDAEPAEPPEDLSFLVYDRLDKRELFSDDRLLRETYGVMVTAHYRNNPNDLMIMADGVHHKIRALMAGDRVVGVIQTSDEGGLPKEMIDFALSGGTFDGDLIPDRLIKHVRLREFGEMRGWRVVRIAVVQELQDMGLGSTMLGMLVKEAEEEGLDWVGSAFMGDPRVLKFWIKNGFVPVHVAPRRNEKLGDFPVVVMRPISERGKKAVQVAAEVLKDKMLNVLHDVYFSMPPEVARLILVGAKAHREVQVSKVLLDKAVAFLKGVSPYESSADAIHALVVKYFWDSKRDWSLTEEEEIALIAKVLQGRPWRFSSTSLGSSRLELTQLIYDAVEKLLQRYYGLTRESPMGLTLNDV